MQQGDFGATQIGWVTSSNDIHNSKQYTRLNGVHAHVNGVHFHAHANGVHAHANGVHVHAHANGVHVHAQSMDYNYAMNRQPELQGLHRLHEPGLQRLYDQGYNHRVETLVPPRFDGLHFQTIYTILNSIHV